MKIDPLEPNDDWLADEYWEPSLDEPEEDEDEDEDGFDDDEDES